MWQLVGYAYGGKVTLVVTRSPSRGTLYGFQNGPPNMKFGFFSACSLLCRKRDVDNPGS